MRKPKKEKKDNKIIEDDGRVIASMNVEGMPWYLPGQTSGEEKGDLPPLNKKETRSFMFSALLAALVVAGIFIVLAALFILFATKVWLK